MIVLDTDHINALQYEGAQAATLVSGMSRSTDQDFATTIFTPHIFYWCFRGDEENVDGGEISD